MEVPGEAPPAQGGFGGTRSLLLSKQAWKRGRGYRPALLIGGALFAAVVIGVAVSVATGSAQAFSRYGISFVWSGTFSPGAGEYAAGILVIGTLLTTGVALVLAGPVGIGAAIALSELIPKKLAATASTVIELLAAVPSIVVGLWALIGTGTDVCQARRAFPWPPPCRWRSLQRPRLRAKYPPCVGRPGGHDTSHAGLALPHGAPCGARGGQGSGYGARGDAMAGDPQGGRARRSPRDWCRRHARHGPGAGRSDRSGDDHRQQPRPPALADRAWCDAWVCDRQPVRRGPARSRYERGDRPRSSPAGPDGGSEHGRAGLASGGPVRGHGSISGWPACGACRPAPPAAPGGGPEAAGAAHRDAAPGVGQQGGTGAVSAEHTLSRRLFRGRLAQVLCVGALAAAAAPLVALIAYTVARALPALSLGLLTHPVVPEGVPGGGISTAIAGSARAVGIGLLIAAPLGLLTGLFLYERKGRVAGVLRFSADVLTGVPSIVIGIFAFEVVVRPMHKPSTLAAGIALAVLMLPIMVRADEEAIRSVAVDLQEAGAALGASRWRVVRSVVLRGSLPGLVAGNLLALARAIGETAPLLFTLAAPTLALTWLIYTDATEPFPAEQQLAWAAALVLLAAVFVFSVLARAVAWSLTRRAR